MHVLANVSARQCWKTGALSGAASPGRKWATETQWERAKRFAPETADWSECGSGGSGDNDFVSTEENLTAMNNCRN